MNLQRPPTMKFGQPFDLLNIDESALSRDWQPRALLYWEDAAPKPYKMQGDVAVVEITGALDTRGGWWWDGYDTILERVSAALNDPKVHALVLSFDSPGGMAAGNLDAAMALRAAVEASGKPCIAHAGTMACSAAYALACAADAIHVTVDGVVGSIGTIATVYDRTKANEKEGYDVRVVRSGNLKADPHPDVALTDASVARVRARVVELAGFFGAWVSSRRPQLGDPLSLQGACVYGADAVARGCADQVGTLGAAITHAATLAADSSSKRKTTMDAKQALETIGAMRAQLQVGTDEEVAASVATLKATAAQVPDLNRQLAEARTALATRVKAEADAAREAVLEKHRKRGALSKADEADAVYMGTLAPLTPEQLDANLSRRPSMAVEPAAPRSTGAVDPTKVDSDAATLSLTAEEKEWAKTAGVSEAAMLTTKIADAKRAAARQG